MGSVVKSVFGGGDGPSSGGQGGVNDLTGGLQDQSNELLNGLGADRNARTTMVNNFTQALADQAAGKAPSLAEAQMRQAQDRNLQQQMALARSNRAVNPALAARQTQMMAGQAAGQTNQDAAIARLQERNQAQSQFGNFLGQQYQMAAQSRAAALGGAQAAANIDAANQHRADQQFGGILQGMGSNLAQGMTMGATPPTGGAAPGAKPPGKYQGGIIKDISDGEEQDEIMQASNGALVPGQPTVNGDSPKNDVVPIMASPGELVIPRSVVSKGHKAVANFAEAVLKREAKPQKLHKGGLVSGFGSVLSAKNDYEQNVKHIESKFGKAK